MCAGIVTRPDTVFMGFYAVEPEYQGIGAGRELWSKTTGRLSESTNIGLYGVPSMMEKYKKSGFGLEDTIRMLIYESDPGVKSDQLNTRALKDIDQLIGCRLVRVDGRSSEATFQKLVDYDQSVQKFSREKLLRFYLTGDDVPLTFAVVKDHSQQSRIGERKSSCCARPSEVSIIEDEALSTAVNSTLSLSSSNLGELQFRSASPMDIPSPNASPISPPSPLSPLKSGADLDQQQSGDFEILGYGCIRLDNNSGGIIGPIYADSSDICEVLLKKLMTDFKLEPGNIFSVMALSSNKHASKILTKVGLREMDQCSRMFTKFVPAASFSKIYYVHSPNFSLF